MLYHPKEALLSTGCRGRLRARKRPNRRESNFLLKGQEQQRDAILQKFPMAKCDSATTKSIELLPRDVKDRIFDLVVEKNTLDVIDAFLASTI